jgi:hypothetical protein
VWLSSERSPQTQRAHKHRTERGKPHSQTIFAMELVEQLAKRVIIRPTYFSLLHMYTFPSIARHTFLFCRLFFGAYCYSVKTKRTGLKVRTYTRKIMLLVFFLVLSYKNQLRNVCVISYEITFDVSNRKLMSQHITFPLHAVCIVIAWGRLENNVRSHTTSDFKNNKPLTTCVQEAIRKQNLTQENLQSWVRTTIKCLNHWK